MSSSSTNSDMSEDYMVGNEMNEFLDEALVDSDSEPTSAKRSCLLENDEVNT